MQYTCPVCGAKMEHDMSVIHPHSEEHIIKEIEKAHPDWSAEDGVCKKCYEFYKSQFPHRQ